MLQTSRTIQQQPQQQTTAANIELVLTTFRQGLAEQGYSKSQPKTQNTKESRVDYNGYL